MLKPVPMTRVELLVLDSDLPALSERIGALAVLHPADVRAIEEWAGLTWREMEGLDADYRSVERRLDRVADFLRLPSTEAEGVPISPSDALARAESLLERLEPDVDRLAGRLAELHAGLLRLDALVAQVALFGDVGVDLAALRGMRFLYLSSGLAPVVSLPRLDESLESIPHLLIPARRVGDRQLLLAFSRREDAEVLDRALQSAYVERVEIPAELSGSPDEALAQLAERRREFQDEAREIAWEREALRERREAATQAARALVAANGRVVELWRLAGRTERTRLLVGWAPRASREELLAAVTAATGGRALLATQDPLPADQPPGGTAPTALSNPPAFRPFELLTRTYGLPDYWDLDPTPLAAFMFVLIFGAMFGDLGQGAVLASVGFALSRGRLVANQRDFGRILALSGLSAMIFGVLYGSLFGAEAVIPALWLRPFEQPLLLIGYAIGFGALMLSVGLVLGVIAAWRRRDPMGLVLGPSGLAGLWLYWGLIALAALAVLAPGRLSVPVLALLVGVPLALIFLHLPIGRAVGWTREPVEGSYAIQSGVETFDLAVRLVSNTVSFLRIGAFALGHVGLGLTVFALAGLVRGLPGAPVAVLVLGNLLIIGLEGLVVGIQALRLEYYEFFTKFLRGGGLAYRPFALRGHRLEAGRQETED